MARFTGIPVSILGTGAYVPDKIMTNADLEKIVDTSDEWIRERTGIRERRVAGDGETTSHMSFLAAKEALSNSGLDAADLDMILVGTNSPDTIFPAVASRVQGMLGAVNSGAMDIQAGCPGSVYAMTVASAGIQAGMWKNVLVIGAEVFTAFVDWTDRNTCVIFGDGAGACVMTAGDEGLLRVVAADLKGDGTKHDYIELRAGSSSLPASFDTIKNSEHFVKMKGQDVFKLVNREIPVFLRSFCEANALKPQDIDWWILHQANERMIASVLRRMSIPSEKALMNLERYGNTCAASVMLLLHEALTDKKIEKGQKIIFSSFGAGMSWGALLLEA